MSVKLLESLFEFTDARGTLREILNGKTIESINHHYRKAGCKCGGHYHKVTEEYFYIVSGLLEVETRKFDEAAIEKFTVPPGKALYIPAYYHHSTYFPEDTHMITLLSRAFSKDDTDTFK